MELAILSVSFLIFLVLGVPVSFALGIERERHGLFEGLPIAPALPARAPGMTPFPFRQLPLFLDPG
ncbi:hypothetical protein DWU95_01695, partial [Burkholderia contaminans]